MLRVTPGGSQHEGGLYRSTPLVGSVFNTWYREREPLTSGNQAESVCGLGVIAVGTARIDKNRVSFLKAGQAGRTGHIVLCWGPARDIPRSDLTNWAYTEGWHFKSPV